MLKRYQRAKNDPVFKVSIIDESSPPDVATARAVDASRNARGATAAGRDGTLDDTRWIMPFFCFRGCGSPKATALLAVRARTAVTSFMLGQSRRSVRGGLKLPSRLWPRNQRRWGESRGKSANG